MSVNIRRLILKLAYPFTLLMGKVGVHRLIKDFEYNLIIGESRPGDLLLSRKRFELSNLFIPGKYTHSAMVLPGELIVEATGEGVAIKSMASFAFDKDFIAILRPIQFEEIEMLGILNKCDSIIGAPYDYLFELSEKAFYCSELVFNLYKTGCKFFDTFTLRKSLGVDTVVPDDYYKARKYFNIIGEY